MWSCFLNIWPCLPKLWSCFCYIQCCGLCIWYGSYLVIGKAGLKGESTVTSWVYTVSTLKTDLEPTSTMLTWNLARYPRHIINWYYYLWHAFLFFPLIFNIFKIFDMFQYRVSNYYRMRKRKVNVFMERAWTTSLQHLTSVTKLSTHAFAESCWAPKAARYDR